MKIAKGIANDYQEHIGVIERVQRFKDGTKALVSGHPQYTAKWVPVTRLRTSCTILD